MKKMLSLALALAMCLGLAAPAFAAEETLTRVGFAMLLVQYAKPDEKERGEIPADCVGLTKEEKDAVAFVMGNGLMMGDGDGNFLPNDPISCGAAAVVLGRKEEDVLIHSPMPEVPDSFEDREGWAIYDQAEDALNEKLSQELGVIVPIWLTRYADGLYNSGVIKSGTISSFYDPIPKATAEEWLKALYSPDETEEPTAPVEQEKPTAPVEQEKPTAPAGPEKPDNTAYASTQTVDVDGKAVEFEMYALKNEEGNMTNYVKLRDLAIILDGTQAQFAVGWNGAVNIETGKAYTPNGTEMKTPYSGDRAYQAPTAPTNINGAAAEKLTAIVLTDDAGNGYTYYQLRDLGRYLGFNVGWSAAKGVFVETDKPYAE